MKPFYLGILYLYQTTYFATRMLLVYLKNKLGQEHAYVLQ